jgi:hypothetical protein
MHEHADAVLLNANEAAPLQFRMDTLVDLGAGTVGRRNHQRTSRRLCIVASDGRDALVVALNLVDAGQDSPLLLAPHPAQAARLVGDRKLRVKWSVSRPDEVRRERGRRALTLAAPQLHSRIRG